MNVLLTFIVFMLALIIIGGCIELFIIPHLNPENRFNKWWKKNVIDYDPDHL